MADPATLGKYEVRGTLGKGAMGIVYKGYDPTIDRYVALKTVRKDMVEAEVVAQYMGRFKNEARAAGRLHHPNIVSVYEYGEDDTAAFIAMEYVEGAGLRDYLNRARDLRLRRARAALRPVARRSRLRACPRRGASRHQAVQPHGEPLRRPQDRRLRHRPHRCIEPHHGRHGDRHAVVHVARAVPRLRGGCALRPLLHRCGDVRAPRGREAVSRQPRGRHLQDLPRVAAAALHAVEAQAAARGRCAGGQGAGQERGRSLPPPRAPFATRSPKWRRCPWKWTTALAPPS